MKRKPETAICPKCRRKYITNERPGYVWMVFDDPRNWCDSLRNRDGSIYYQHDQCTIAELRARVHELEETQT